MPRRNSTTEIKDGKVVFSKEVLSYFESIRTEENSAWIDKYFEYLSDESNLSAEKYNGHHIIPCFTFKDETHRTRKETEPLANKVEGNIIKLSIYNHILAHYCLWKIFDNYNSKHAIQYTIGKDREINDLSENQIKEIARIREECAEKNQTEEEMKEKQKEYRMSERGKESQRKRSAKYNNSHKELVSKRKKKYRETHKEERSQYWSEYYKNNKEQVDKTHKKYRDEHKEDYQKYNHEYSEKYFKQVCYDPIKNDYPTLGALRGRIYNHKELYKNIIPTECIIEENQFNTLSFPNISS